MCAKPLKTTLAELDAVEAALAHFGLPANLPAVNSGISTRTAPVVLPAEYTETLRRARGMRES